MSEQQDNAGAAGENNLAVVQTSQLSHAEILDELANETRWETCQDDPSCEHEDCRVLRETARALEDGAAALRLIGQKVGYHGTQSVSEASGSAQSAAPEGGRSHE